MHISSRTGIVALVSTIIFFPLTIYGEAFGAASNSLCYALLGCNEGFFGYDALEHFLFGFGAVWVIVWACQTYPRYSILNATFWKSAFILVATVALVSVAWEIVECLRDAYLLDIAQESLFNFRLHINLLDQPSNFDTMGDLSFSLLGSLLALPLLRR